MAILLLGFGLQLQILWASFLAGGHVWLQGDWLISLASGPVRRGAFGELFLRISDALQISPLSLVIGVQTTLVLSIYLGVARLLWVQRRSVMALVLFTPGIFAILWGIDPISALRKEIIGLAALVWLAQPGGNTARLILTGVMVLVGGLGHEIMILMLPAWIVGVWLLHPHIFYRPIAWAVMGVVVFVASVELFYAVRNMRIEDAEPICAALTQRGLSQHALCGGAIAWLADPQNGTTKVWAAMQRSWTVWLLPVAWMIAAAPLWRIWNTSTSLRSNAGWLILIAIAPICLLYPVGLDWGRWFAVQVTIAAILMLGLGARNLLPKASVISPVERVLWLISSMSWGLLHDPIVTTQGFLVRIIG